MAPLLTRSVLLGPAALARAAAMGVRDPVARWMLYQPREVRASYVRDVLRDGPDDRRQEIWMLRQPDHVRESYVREVLGG